MTTTNALGSAQDFDFFVGTWQVRHRRLKERLKSCQDWEEFMGRCEMRKTLGGLGNVDDNLLELPAGSYRAVTLRSFDPASGQWSIWWLDGRSPGRLDVPVVGSFSEGVGSFYADDELDGRAIRVRFQWTLPAPDQPRWEQAFSVDGGQSWESNWVMDFEPTATP
ncbi:DUF1579 domain-containing protein [Paucibacter sp. AS339]|uniref:DUF1579 domain-containing protein n=1 Tax=Paucibacter hankyongi TaxID=3133434 RepID=UPI003094F675